MGLLKRNVLIIENDAIIALDIKKRFEEMGFNIIGITPSFCDMLKNLKMYKNVDLILVDASLADFSNCLNLAEKVYKCVKTPLILLSTRIDEFLQSKSEQYESVKLLEKPFKMDELISTAENIMQSTN
jgi:DNA-binding response OmpR family regulator